jgi:MFS family permease
MTAAALDLPDPGHAAQLRKAVIASTVGTTIEWYDFFLYGTAAGLVFGKLFFPNQDPLSATFLAFGTYFVGFAARPIGAAIFGHYGDRIGRKATLIATLLCMGIATFLIAFVPTYDQIGIWGAVLLTLLRMSEQAPFYIFSAFVFAYAVGTLAMPRGLVLAGVMAGACLGFAVVPLAGHISDRIGRCRMFMIGAAVTGLFGFAYFAMLDTLSPVLVFIAVALSFVATNMQYAVEGALIAEAFTPRLRYSGASLGYQLASLIAGGPAPIIATALLASYHSGYAIAIYIAVCAVIGLSAAALMPDHTGKDISAEYDDEAAKATSDA